MVLQEIFGYLKRNLQKLREAKAAILRTFMAPPTG